MKEKRRAQRHILDEADIRSLWYHVVPTKDEQETQCVQGISDLSDISVLGVGLLTNEILPNGREIFIEIDLANSLLSMVGRVVFSVEEEKGRFRSGVEFIILSRNCSKKLMSLIQ